jgi:hypothetical protein
MSVRTVSSTGATAIISHSVDDLFAAPGQISSTVERSITPPVAAGGTLPQSISITGGPNSPATPNGANAPGLNTGEMENSMSKNWKWIALIVLVLLAYWYFAGSGATA